EGKAMAQRKAGSGDDEARSVRRRQEKAWQPERRLSSSVYEQVRERICLLSYRPGTILRETELAEQFGVSRTPVRQALQKLESEGFVEAKNGVGTIVTGFDFAAMRDVYDLRLKLAELIGQLRPNVCTNSHVEAMEALLDRARALRQQRDTEAFWRINHERQGIIGSLIGNSALRHMYDLYYYQTARVWFQVVDAMWDEQVDALCTELSDLIRAMRAGDTQAVAYVERNHLSFYMVLIGRFISGQLDDRGQQMALD
ncbi:MAG: GntR family transcriptional regulator, partial [Kiloniellales bacterium]|nr:GntR family transcriptional regulator [Kiloniellales bacterium]